MKYPVFLAIASLLLSAGSFALPNPASKNCIEKGGALEIRKTTSGAEYGICKWGQSTDSSECEEWALLRGQCHQGMCSLWGFDENLDGGTTSFCRVWWETPS